MALINCFNTLTSFGILMIFLLTQLEAYYTSNTGCHHNGTWYADKSLVPTTEKCLNCQCNKKTLVCRLKVCPEMPMPPPRGCVVVQKKNTCCPYLSCARLDAFYKIPATRRIIAYLDHYERESIDRVVNENMLQRRSDDTDVDLYVCVKNGTVYKSGSAMSSSNLCSYCYCIGGTEKCVKPKCMLPVEGCKPIFVDSTCCPVRYDCSTKQTGKSSQEVRYRKTSNKHYMRMSQRLQRNHGCTVGQQFYTEGQKMKSDKDKPCDICFCIRGQRKCAPKKCAPALRNCIPVVPKGQCCPSSYDCGSQRDYRRSQNSRQFNLFSLIFGKDEENDESTATEIPVQYPHDRDPVSVRPAKYKSPTTEKSFYDALREGLEFIDNNNNQMLKSTEVFEDTPSLQTHFQNPRPSPTPIPLSMHNIHSSTEVSFLDLLLGPSESNQENLETFSEENDSIEDKTVASSTATHWMDFLLSPNETDLKNSESKLSNQIHKNNSANIQDQKDIESTTTSIDNINHNNLEEIEGNTEEINAEQQEKLTISTVDTTSTTDLAAIEETTQTYPTTIAETTIQQIKTTQPMRTETANKKQVTVTKSTSTNTKRPTTVSTTKKSVIAVKTTAALPKAKPTATKPLHNSNKNHTQTNPEKSTDFLAQLLDGLSDILGRENKTRGHIKQAETYKLKINKTSNFELPLFKPLPQDKTYTRINSKIANLTVRPPIILTKDITRPTLKPLQLSGTTNSAAIDNKDFLLNTTTQTPKITTSIVNELLTTTTMATFITSTVTNDRSTDFTTLKPVVIKTNPSILESEPLDQNAEPTLPPSLPNLKIIPFLPTDALKSDHNSASSYEFYHHSAAPISRIDYDLYDDANLYPSITEKYPLYPDLEDGSKAEYIYKFNVEGPDSLVASNAGKFDGTLGAPAFLKYDFAGSGTPSSTKGFSPPTKTEGGFVPKEPLILDEDDHDNVSVKVGDSYHVTQHIIDITTSADVLNTTKVIEITTPDPFKDVIRTEPPPDLTSLIEDKLKKLISKSNATTKTATTSSQADEKPQDVTDFKINLKRTDTQPMTLKMTTKINIKATHNEDNNGNNRTQAEHAINNTTQVLGDKMDDKANIDVNDVSTIPPFKSMPTVQQLGQDNTSTASRVSTKSETIFRNKFKQTETTIKPTGKTTTEEMPTIKINTMTTTERPTAGATIKVNRNKTIAIATTTTTATKTTMKQKQEQQQQHQHQQQEQQKLAKINKNSTLKGNETKILASSTTTTRTKSTSASSSFNSSLSSVGSVSTLKTKSNTTRRITSTKPTKHYKPTTNITLPLATIKSPAKTNAINFNRTLVATRRPQKPTTNANIHTVTKLKTINATNKPITTTTTTATITSTTTPTTNRMRTTSSLPSASPTLHRVPSANPFFMSPFDKLPFMDASFEVKRNSATPSTTTTTTTTASTAYSPQRFAVAATIATDYLLDGVNDDQDSNGDENDSFTSSRHKLMGLVHYKNTLNQLEGFEPSIHQRLQHSSTAYQSTTTQFNTRISVPSSTLPQQQQQQQQNQHSTQQSSSLNNLIDPTGILKLAGCNIYGRMYRVGRIILELSSPCLECKCTEIGVKCGPLNC